MQLHVVFIVNVPCTMSSKLSVHGTPKLTFLMIIIIIIIIITIFLQFLKYFSNSYLTSIQPRHPREFCNVLSGKSELTHSESVSVLFGPYAHNYGDSCLSHGDAKDNRLKVGDDGGERRGLTQVYLETGNYC